MKEYIRLMFTEFDVMNNDDWEKHNRYFRKTMAVGWPIVIIGHLLVLAFFAI